MRAEPDGTVTAVWNQQSVWSQAADRLKRTISRARTAALILGIVSAVLGTAAAQTMQVHAALGKSLAFGAALSAGLVPLAAGRAGAPAVRNWTRLRSMSEALKSEVYVCLAGVAPYRDADRRRVLAARVERLFGEAADLAAYTTGVEPLERALPAVSDVTSYSELRLSRQMTEYYRPKASEMARKTSVVRRAEIALGALAAVLGALAGAFGVAQAAAWVAVAVTAGAAVSAHGVAAKYAFQQTEFTRTAAELQRILEGREVAEGGDAAFVRRCERVMSVLNDSWMVKWTAE
ncbi:DUF4231 domain-containing protein [Streptomyces poonensis]|uniref:DUF4231 domain-containing protein n=1 Tax=Streptomyces poonensis TaxID=68255 RepID=UPI001672BCB2|nr:DUF4231 domain-containing protein [Streptomyces poonensis]